MSAEGGLGLRRYALGPYLRRTFWRPARRALQLLHPLALIAALVVFALLASNGQIREIYLSNLEELSASAPSLMATVGLLCGAIALILLSAILFMTHYELSRTRLGYVFSTYSNPDAGSRLRLAHRMTGFLLAFSPWLGVAAGCLGVTRYLSQRYEALNAAGANQPELQSLHAPHPWQIVVATAIMAICLAAALNHYRRGRILRFASALAPPICAALLLLFLVDSSPGANRGAWMIGALAAAFLFIAARFWLEAKLPRIVYRVGGALDQGASPARRKRQLLFAWSLAPWAALLTGLRLFSPDWLSDENAALSLGIIPIAMGTTIALGLAVAVNLDRLRESEALRWTAYSAVVALVVFEAALSFLGVDSLVATFRWIGPFGSVIFACVLVIASFALLAWLSQRSGFPATTLVIAMIVGGALLPSPGIGVVIASAGAALVLCLAALVSRLYVVAALALVLAAPSVLNMVERASEREIAPQIETGQSVQQAFRNWLERQKPIWAAQQANSYASRLSARAAPTRVQAGEPVYIVATEGGGIYAATAASLMLAVLQDDCPDFSSHVFAISGVSGGAIGATVFQALDELRLRQAADGRAVASSLEAEVSRVMLDDQLSAVIASIFPDLFGKSTRRAQAQAAGFEQSVRALQPSAAEELRRPYRAYWTRRTLAPALVLNTTWVETGMRVAFAPFALHGLVDQSLYSFLDAGMPGVEAASTGSCRHSTATVSLIDAAVDSARFPGMLPPFSVRMKEGRRRLL